MPTPFSDCGLELWVAVVAIAAVDGEKMESSAEKEKRKWAVVAKIPMNNLISIVFNGVFKIKASEIGAACFEKRKLLAIIRKLGRNLFHNFLHFITRSIIVGNRILSIIMREGVVIRMQARY